MEQPRCCLACGATSGIKACSRCRQAYFCNVDCQRRAWPGHKDSCAAAKGAAAPKSAAPARWEDLSDAARLAAGEKWRAAAEAKMLPGATILASCVRLHARAGSQQGPAGDSGRLEAGSRSELRIYGVVHPGAAPAVESLSRLVGPSAGAERCGLRAACAPALAQLPPAHASDLAGMLRDLHSRGSSGGALMRDAAAVDPRVLAMAHASELPPGVAAHCTPAALGALTAGYAWAWIDLVAFDELWVPCYGQAAVSRMVGLQLVGRLPSKRERALEQLALRVKNEIRAAGVPSVALSTDVELCSDPAHTSDGAPAPSKWQSKACAASSCTACKAPFDGRARRCCLQCAARLCEACSEAHDDGHVLLHIEPDAAEPTGLASRLLYSDLNVIPPLAVGCARGRHHPEATCGGCGVRGFTGVLWRSATRGEDVLCAACFDGLDSCKPLRGRERPSDASEQSERRADGLWLRLACWGGGHETVFERFRPLFHTAHSSSADAPLLATTKVYEALWCQGDIFEPEWRRRGLVELAPVPPDFQPAVRDLELKWRDLMRGFATSAPSAPRPSAPCAARSLEELCALPPLSESPLVFEVPNFLSDAECDHFARVGAWRSAPSSGGLIHALGSADWPPCKATDALAAEVEERVGRLVGCAPHANDGGVKLAFTHYDPAAPRGVRAPEGMHLDTNKQPHRFVTVLVYLNDVAGEHGGETCFPLAGASDAERAPARELAVAGSHHTHDRPKEPRLKAALGVMNALAERGARGEGGIRVSPRRGSACVFYSIDRRGAVDADSFHFGASLTAPSAGKWTLQFFKELPLDARSAAGRKAYAARAHPLALGDRSSVAVSVD